MDPSMFDDMWKVLVFWFVVCLLGAFGLGALVVWLFNR